ncbi:uncharacterized protein ARMOST_06045 [Armillaria ostoyae]|uniref:Uncharacterized protein n=1 Tax=Armillaria ostoyae TaxID=47428 RepID=A0A284R1Y3_ARMOS|nr:uncharacterized protein ARMOST_06045 [Armillaria ostoyae]
MSESISPIHLLASQSAPPSHHLSDDSFAFPDALAPLVLPVDPVDIMDTAKKKITRLWPSCVPLFTFTENARLQRRKDRIIQILKLCRNKKLGNGLQIASARVLTHHQYTHTFLEETRMLDCLLMSVFTCFTFTKDVVYKMDENIYQELCTKLTTRHAMASSSLKAFGYSELRPPAWAIDTAKCLTANDFEIYALQYRVRVEHFLHMLDYVHDWNRLQTRVHLDEELLATQCNADRARLENREYHFPAVPPKSYSNPFKSKTSFRASASDFSWGRIHYDTSRDEEQHLSNSQVTKIRGQCCLCANSKVLEDLDSTYQGCSPGNPDSPRGGNNGNRPPSRRGPCNSQIPAYHGHSEHTSIDSDTAFKETDIPTCNSNPNARASCGNKSNNTPALNQNSSDSVLHYSTNNETNTTEEMHTAAVLVYLSLKRTSSSLDTFGYSDLRPPAWAIDTTKGLTANDFEIYGLQYRICVEHFLYMLDDVHDWDECQTRMMLDENLLAAQRNADRAHLGKQEYYLPTAPPASHSNPPKSKTSRQDSASDWSLGGVHGIITREEEQYSQKKTVPNLKALDYDTNTSISQNLTGNGIRTFRIASNTPCTYFSEESKSCLLPRKIRRRISRLQRFHCEHRPIGMRECISAFTILGSEATQIHVGINTINLNVLQNTLDSDSYTMPFSRTEIPTLSTRPQGRIKQTITSCLARHRIKVEKATAPSTINRQCQLYRRKGCNCCHPKYRRVRREVQAQEYFMMSPGHSIRVKINMKPQTMRRNLFLEERLSREICWQQGAHLPYHVVFRLFVLRIANIRGSLTSMRKLDDRIRDPGININGIVEINIVQDNETGYPGLQGKDPQPGRVLRANELIVLIAQQKDGHGDQHHQYHSYFGNNSLATTKANPLRCCCTMKPSSIRASPKRHSGASCIHINLLFKQHISQETHQQRDYDSPYHFVSPSALHISNIGSSLTAVEKRNTTSPVRLPGKWFHSIRRGNQRMKRRSRTARKSQRIRTMCNPHRLTRINTQIIQDTASRCELITTFFRHLPRFTLADVHRAFRASQISRFLAIQTALRDILAEPMDRQQRLQRILCSPRWKFLCQVTPEICISLTTVGSWNATSPVHIPGKWFRGIFTGSQRMKQRPCSTRKSQHIRRVHNPCQLAIRISTQRIPNSTFEELGTTGRNDITTFLHHIPSFTLTLGDRELGEFLVHRASHRFQNSRAPAISTMLQDLTASFTVQQQDLQGIRHSPQSEFLCQLSPESNDFHRFSVYCCLEIIAEIALTKRESKRLLAYHQKSVALNIASPKLGNFPEKAEHNQSNQNVPLIDVPSGVPEEPFAIPIAVSSGFISGHAETSFLACSTSLAPTAPGPSADDTKVLGLKPRIHAPGDEMNNTEASSQCQKLDTILSVNGTKAGSIRRRNDGAHHQYRSHFGNSSHEPAAHADSQLRHMQPRASSTHISPEPNLGACSYGNHFEFTIIVDSGHSSTHSLTVPDRAPKLDFNLILDPSMNEKSVHDGIPQCGEPCPPYVEDVG